MFAGNTGSNETAVHPQTRNNATAMNSNRKRSSKKYNNDSSNDTGKHNKPTKTNNHGRNTAVQNTNGNFGAEKNRNSRSKKSHPHTTAQSKNNIVQSLETRQMTTKKASVQQFSPEEVQITGQIVNDPVSLGFQVKNVKTAPRPVPKYMIQQSRLLITPPFVQNEWDKQNQAKMSSMEENMNGNDYQGLYEEFQKMRETERKKMEGLGLVDAENVSKDLNDAISFNGTCVEMCPIYERVRRQLENNVKALEKDPLTNLISKDRAIKAFSRPAAGQPPPLPSDVRPPQVLKNTLKHIIDNILPQLPDSHSFIWDRTRSIRQDFTYQNSFGPEAIDCNEKIVRIHLVSLHIMAGSDLEYSQQQELEQFNKALQTLLEIYEDIRNHGGEAPNEAEFRAYYLLSHIRDPEPERVLQKLPLHILHDKFVQLALMFRGMILQSNIVERGYQNSVGSLAMFSEFFKMVYAQDTPVLISFLLETHFNEIRFYALKSMARSYHTKSKPYSAETLSSMLGFNDIDSLLEFIKYYEIDTIRDNNGSIYVDLFNKEKLESQYKLNSLQDKPKFAPPYSPQLDYKFSKDNLGILVECGKPNQDLKLNNSSKLLKMYSKVNSPMQSTFTNNVPQTKQFFNSTDPSSLGNSYGQENIINPTTTFVQQQQVQQSNTTPTFTLQKNTVSSFTNSPSNTAISNSETCGDISNEKAKFSFPQQSNISNSTFRAPSSSGISSNFAFPISNGISTPQNTPNNHDNKHGNNINNYNKNNNNDNNDNNNNDYNVKNNNTSTGFSFNPIRSQPTQSEGTSNSNIITKPAATTSIETVQTKPQSSSSVEVKTLDAAMKRTIIEEIYKTVLDATINEELKNFLPRVIDVFEKGVERKRRLEEASKAIFSEMIHNAVAYKGMEVYADEWNVIRLKRSILKRLVKTGLHCIEKLKLKKRKQQELESVEFSNQKPRKRIKTNIEKEKMVIQKNDPIAFIDETQRAVKELWEPLDLKLFIRNISKKIKIRIESKDIELKFLLAIENWSYDMSKWLNNKLQLKANMQQKIYEKTLNSDRLKLEMSSLPQEYENRQYFTKTPFVMLDIGLVDSSITSSIATKLEADNRKLAKLVELLNTFNYYKCQIVLIYWDISQGGTSIHEVVQKLDLERIGAQEIVSNIYICDMTLQKEITNFGIPGESINERIQNAFKMLDEGFKGEYSARGLRKLAKYRNMLQKKSIAKTEANEKSQAAINIQKRETEQMRKARALRKFNYLTKHMMNSSTTMTPSHSVYMHDINSSNSTFNQWRSSNKSLTNGLGYTNASKTLPKTFFNTSSSSVMNDSTILNNNVSILGGFGQGIVEESTPFSSPKKIKKPHSQNIPKGLEELRNLTSGVKRKYGS